MSLDDDSFFTRWPDPSRSSRIIVSTIIEEEIKIICWINELGVWDISRYECDIFSDRIEHFGMIDRAKYIADLLIGEIIDTSSCDISDHSDASDEVQSDTI